MNNYYQTIRSVFVIFLLTIVFYADAQVSSDFSTNDEGWKVFDTQTGLTSSPTYNGTGGNPGGYISFSTLGSYAGIYFQAPAKFLGNQSLAYNQNLTFDLKVSAAGSDNTSGDIIISSATFGTIYYQLPTKPSATQWSSYSVQMNESQWHFGSIAGTAPTKTQMKRILSAVPNLQIRLKYLTGNTFTYTSQLDNVVLNSATIPTAPSITSFSPASGLPNTTVTINGSNFGATPAQNVVYFNGTKGTIINATATQITVSSPSRISNGPITVVNLTSGAQGTTRTNFNPLFDNNKDFGGRVIASSFGKYVAFGTAPSFQVGTTGFSIGDLDGDGWQDVVTSRNDAGAQYVQVFRNAQQSGGVSASSFAAAVTLSLPNSPTGLSIGRVGQTAIADMDGDGKLDVVVNLGYASGNDDNSFIIFLNQSTSGNLAFASPYLFQIADAQNNNEGIAVADMDGDGRPDILTAFQNSACQLTILQNLSTPGNLDFAYPQNFAQGVTMGIDISVGDLNGDNKPEVLVQAYLNGAINVYENTSTPGTISLGVPFNVASNTTANIKVADMDNDGKNDIFFRDYGVAPLGPIRLKKNNYSSGALKAADFGADIVLTQQIASGLNSPSSYTTLSDVNGDNKPDIIMSDGINVAVYQNNYTSGAISASSFYSGIVFEGGNNSNQYILSADIDGDNKPEILIRPQSGAGFWVYHNECFPAPQIASISPSTSNVGNSITITGDLMNTSNATARVRIANQLATSNTASNTSVTATVPLGAKSGSLTVTEHGLTASKSFGVLFNTNRIINASSFGPSIDFALTATVRDALEVGDFDDDGKIDVTVIDQSFTGKIFQNAATAGQPISASSLTQLGTTYSATYNTIALDVDGDGKIDLNNGNLLQNTSSGSISFNTFTTTAGGFFVGTKSDFNKDGKVDLALNNGGGNIQVFENLSRTGAFTPIATFQNFPAGSINFPIPGVPNGMAAADFDGDGFDDIISVHSFTGNSTYYLNGKNTGPITTASFTSLGNFTTSGTNPYDITANDFDGDGKIDIAITYYNSAFVSIKLNTSTVGNITFSNVDVPVANKGYKITSQDLDGDGKAEIIIIHQPNPGPGSFTVLQNKCTVGNVNFSATNFAITRNPQQVNIADINNDQKPDILIVGSGGAVAPANALMVFENKVTSASISITTQPFDFSACVGAVATYTTAATGTTNITYQWQFSPDGVVPFTDIANGGGYSNVTTATLSVNTTGNFGLGRYRCRINGDFAAQVFTNDEGLFINPLPTAPTATGASGCPNTTITLNAAGGTNGQYRWYTVPTAGTAISGQTNSSYSISTLTTTTTYYVAINNGLCESTRTSVVATITTPNAPTVTGGQGCPNTLITLNASGGINGQYRWYAVATGGTAIAGQTNSSYSISTLTATATYYVAINNGICEGNRTAVVATVNVCNPPSITAQVLTTPAGGTIVLDLTKQITSANLDLTSLKIITLPANANSASIDAKGLLTVDYTGKNFVGTEKITIRACDTNGQCTQQDFEIDVVSDVIIYNALSPGGANPTFVVQFIDQIAETKSNTVTIFDRWENEVWKGTNYDNSSVVFKGVSDSGNDLPTGTYFYRIDFASGKKSKTGFISLKR